MDDPEDLIRAFGADSDDTKRENFERSTLRLLLMQLGRSSAEVRGLASDLGPEFGWDWFNRENLIRARVGSTREFRFNLIELLTKPNQHAIVEAFRTFRGKDEQPCCLVFHIYDAGRWVATNLATPDDSSIHVVTRDLKFNVVSFARFFSNRWEQPR